VRADRRRRARVTSRGWPSARPSSPARLTGSRSGSPAGADRRRGPGRPAGADRRPGPRSRAGWPRSQSRVAGRGWPTYSSGRPNNGPPNGPRVDILFQLALAKADSVHFDALWYSCDW